MPSTYNKVKLFPLQALEIDVFFTVVTMKNANVVPSSLILVTLMMEAIRSSETALLTRGTRR
jgi:hypothetical protein